MVCQKYFEKLYFLLNIDLVVIEAQIGAPESTPEGGIQIYKIFPVWKFTKILQFSKQKPKKIKTSGFLFSFEK